MKKNVFDFDIQGKKVGVFGLQGSGKTVLAKEIIRRKFKAPIVYSPHSHEWRDELVYLYKAKDMLAELDAFFRKCIEWAKNDKIDCVVVDEADLLFRNNFALPQNVLDIFANHRHYPEGRGVSLLFISRRPQDLPTMFVEASYLNVVFKLEGDNVKKKFNNIRGEFGDKICSDDFKYRSYKFFIKEIGEPEFLHNKILIRSKLKKGKKAVKLDKFNLIV